jgi:hypothetical protein
MGQASSTYPTTAYLTATLCYLQSSTFRCSEGDMLRRAFLKEPRRCFRAHATRALAGSSALVEAHSTRAIASRCGSPESACIIVPVAIPKSSESKPANLLSTRMWRVVRVSALNSAASKDISFGPAPRMLKHRGEHRLSDYFIIPRIATLERGSLFGLRKASRDGGGKAYPLPRIAHPIFSKKPGQMHGDCKSRNLRHRVSNWRRSRDTPTA